MELYAFLFIGCLASVAHGTCVYQILKCTKLYRRLSADTILFDPEFVLDIECKLQEQFFTCLADVAPTCYKERTEIPVPYEFIAKQNVLTQLCTVGSSLRSKYMKESFYISMADTSLCTSEAYLGTDLKAETSPEKRCWLTLISRSCIIALLKDQCGDEASTLYKKLTVSLLGDDDCALPYVSGESAIEEILREDGSVVIGHLPSVLRKRYLREDCARERVGVTSLQRRPVDDRSHEGSKAVFEEVSRTECASPPSDFETVETSIPPTESYGESSGDTEGD